VCDKRVGAATHPLLLLLLSLLLLPPPHHYYTPLPRFGESGLHACEVLLKDMADSKRLDANIR
jgi:hypothetical protein